MPIKLTCPHCGEPRRFTEPLPQPGMEFVCAACKGLLKVTYPPAIMEKLKARGKKFKTVTVEFGPPREVKKPKFVVDIEHPTEPAQPVRSIRPQSTVLSMPAPTLPDAEPLSKPPPPLEPSIAPTPESDPTPRSVWKRVGYGLFAMSAIAAILVGATAAIAYKLVENSLPSTESLLTYRPAAVTEVYDHKGALMGEIYEQRRYVLPLDEIPKHMQNAFIAAEDAGFWDHAGVDYVGLLRAVLNEVAGGDKSQGASTITMQVTRNFLLTRDKTYKRKIKEIMLSRRLEAAYTKEHILFLYLNELYLGSGAYGVEAASRVYFGKHISEVSIAEAALIAGLAPAPSKYSPHMSWDKAKVRQGYVLRQLLDNDLITSDEFEAAKVEEIIIVKEDNPFLKASPHFTEYVRRHLISEYGHHRVYNEGLRVTTTCDLEMQRTAQEAVANGVLTTDKRIGFRRLDVETVASNADILKVRQATEQTLRKRNAFEKDPAGRVPLPAKSVLSPGEVYDAVVLEVKANWVKIGIGAHDAIIPLKLSTWAYAPEPRRGWRGRRQTSFLDKVDGDGDGKKDGSILRAGDKVLAKIRVLSSVTADSKLAKALKKTPAGTAEMIVAELWQNPVVEGSLLSYELATGAVRAMVGGADFERSEFNKATQAFRQIGSTFKPIVYGAAINSQRVTSATMITDAPMAFETNDDFIWKPSNYGRDYLGNITLRKALALSRNTCTIKVLEVIDPGMNDGVIYNFARSLGIGGPPTYMLPDDHITTPKNDHLCPWLRETKKSTICKDRFPSKDPNLSNTRHRQIMGPDDVYMCRACDMSMGLGTSSLTMEELLRAYSAFASGGHLIQPYYIDEVRDRNGEVLETHAIKPFPKVISSEVATIMTWLLQQVAINGTAAKASRELNVPVGGKTGTTDSQRDAWFVGFTNELVTGTWVGYEKPKNMGAGHTGGVTALPPWIEFMKYAIQHYPNRRFPIRGEIVWANIDEEKGIHVTSGGRGYPFIAGTVPESSGVAVGQVTAEDLMEL